jgi:hypothetical protein
MSPIRPLAMQSTHMLSSMPVTRMASNRTNMLIRQMSNMTLRETTPQEITPQPTRAISRFERMTSLDELLVWHQKVRDELDSHEKSLSTYPLDEEFIWYYNELRTDLDTIQTGITSHGGHGPYYNEHGRQHYYRKGYKFKKDQWEDYLKWGNYSPLTCAITGAVVAGWVVHERTDSFYATTIATVGTAFGALKAPVAVPLILFAGTITLAHKLITYKPPEDSWGAP